MITSSSSPVHCTPLLFPVYQLVPLTLLLPYVVSRMEHTPGRRDSDEPMREHHVPCTNHEQDTGNIAVKLQTSTPAVAVRGGSEHRLNMKMRSESIVCKEGAALTTLTSSRIHISPGYCHHCLTSKHLSRLSSACVRHASHTSCVMFSFDSFISN